MFLGGLSKGLVLPILLNCIQNYTRFPTFQKSAARTRSSATHPQTTGRWSPLQLHWVSVGQCDCKVTLNGFWKAMVIWEGSWDIEEKKVPLCGELQAAQPQLVPEKGRQQEFFCKGQNTVSIKVWKKYIWDKIIASKFIDTESNSGSP